MTGEAIPDADVRLNSYKGGRPYIEMKFHSAGEPTSHSLWG